MLKRDSQKKQKKVVMITQDINIYTGEDFHLLTRFTVTSACMHPDCPRSSMWDRTGFDISISQSIAFTMETGPQRFWNKFFVLRTCALKKKKGVVV